MDKRKLIELVRNISLMLGAVILTALCIEIVLRLYDPMDRKTTREIQNAVPAQGGLREPLPQIPKPEGEFRILALGDSYTWGDGLPDINDTWPKKLENLLKEQFKDRNIRVINLGMCGLTTVNEFELLVKVGGRLEPDIVIVQYLLNDCLPSGPNLARVGEDWLDSERTRNIFRNESTHALFGKYSYLYTFVNDKLLALQRKYYHGKTWEELYEDDAPGWIAEKRAFIGMKQFSEQNGIKLVVAMYPVLADGKWNISNYPFEDIYSKVYRFLLASRISCVNLIEYFVVSLRDFKYWKVSAANGHPNGEANKMTATVLREFLVKNEYII